MTYQPSFQLKLDRAAEHLQSIEAQERVWRQSDPRRVWTEPDIQSGGKLVWAEVLKPPPITLAPIVGDCLHNLRSALDNLAYELALAHKGSKMSKSIADKFQFPIFKSRTGFDDKGKPVIRGVHPDAETIIEGLQPYNRENRPGTASTLWILSVLSNSDKHRVPHLAAAAPHEFTMLGTHRGYLSAPEFFTDPFDDRAIIAKFVVPLGTYAEVSMKRPPTFGIAFGERSPDIIQGHGVHRILTFLSRFVNEVVVPPLVKYLA
jgi:hypothetical protein